MRKRGSILPDEAADRIAIRELVDHHHVGIPAEVAQAVNRYDVRMLEASERLRFAEEAF